MALTDKLTAIADGFRTSRGTEQKYTLDEMAVLAAEKVGGGLAPNEKAYQFCNVVSKLNVTFVSSATGANS